VSIVEEIAENVLEAMQDLALRLESRASEAAELRTRLELTAQTQSTVEEERKRLLDELTEERERSEKLQAERSKGFWQRLFDRTERAFRTSPVSRGAKPF
jgi:predicted nuclease with TOPRIM domain